MTKEELRRKVQLELSRRRQRAITLAEDNKAIAYHKIPRLLVLDNLSIDIGIQLARLGAAGGHLEEREEQKRLLDEVAKERRALLVEANFAPDFLEPRYTCPDCKDVGRTPQGICSCVTLLTQKLRRDEINARFPLSMCSFENFSLLHYKEEIDPAFGISAREQMTEVLERCKRYAAEFRKSSPNLYLFGETGIGKTHLALSIASEVLKKQFNVVYVSSQNIFFAMQQDRAEAANIIETLLAADLLILDDLGTELVNAYVISTLYNIVDTRMGRKRPTIYTTNIIDEALLTARYTEKISSRLLGSCEMYRLLGDDIRLQS